MAGDLVTDVCCGKKVDWQRPDKKGHLVVSTKSSPLWLKFGPLETPGIIAFSSVVDVVKLYRVDAENKPVLVGVSGDSVLTSKRQILSSTIAFPISHSELGKTLYFLIEQKNQVSFMLNFEDRQTFDEQDIRANLVRMGLFGAVIMIILFNVAVSLVSRQITFFFNACSIFSILGLSLYMTGTGAAYVWPNSPSMSNLVLAVSIGSSIVFGALFAISFLHRTGKKNLPNKVWLIPAGFAVIITLSGIMLPHHAWMQVILALMFLLFTGLAGSMSYLAIKGNTLARIFLIPLTLAVLPGFLFFTANRMFGLQLGEYSKYLLEMTLCAEALFFSLSLSTRLRLAERERLETVEELVKVQKSTGRFMIRAIDIERRRIASDLHDTAGQSMMMISSRLAMLKKDFKLEEALNRRVSEVAAFSKETISDIRRISYELHPAAIDHLGWRAAVESLFDGLSTAKNVKVEQNIMIEEALLDSAQQIHVYRIIQEIISNIARHSQAENCRAVISRSAGNVIIEICDDGKFGESEFAKSTTANGTMSLGKTIIEYRVQALSGSWKILTKKGDAPKKTGLCVLIKFPIKPKYDY